MSGRGSGVPLLVRLGGALLVAGLLPVAISSFQLKSNRDALKDQVLRTHLVASSSAAARVSAHLGRLESIGRGLAENRALLSDPRSEVSQDLVRGTLAAQPDVASIGLYTAEGETVLAARRSDLRAELGVVGENPEGPAVDLEEGEERRWIVLRIPAGGDAGVLMLVGDATPLEEAVQALELGDEAALLLADRSGRALAGEAALEDFPPEVLERARSGGLQSGASPYTREGLIVGHEAVADTDWFVLSRQPSAIAEVAEARIRRATRFGMVGAVVAAGLLSALVYLTVVRPIRRLVRAQRQLAGLGAGEGSEIAQLEEAFDRLAERVRSREEIGDVFLGRYQIVELLGSGAMGSVFKGWDPRLQRSVAVKTLQVEGEKESDREELAAQLVEEAVTSARFNHPNIVTVYDVAAQGGAAFIAMELVEGVSLETWLRREGPMHASETVNVGIAMARALAAAHEAGLVHHDVKPGNVLMGSDASIKVTDFGISEILSTASRGSGKICGTPGYLPPEALETGTYTEAGDLFALGCVLYRCLTGREAFWNGDFRETIVRTMAGRPSPIVEVAPDTPSELVDLVRHLMANDARQRPGSAAEVLDRLETIAADHGWAGRARPVRDVRQAGPVRSAIPSGYVTIAQTRPGGGPESASPSV